MKLKIANGGIKRHLTMLFALLPAMPATPAQKWLQIGLETSVILVRVWRDLFVSNKIFCLVIVQFKDQKIINYANPHSCQGALSSVTDTTLQVPSKPLWVGMNPLKFTIRNQLNKHSRLKKTSS